jgi:hypothetical protein
MARDHATLTRKEKEFHPIPRNKLIWEHYYDKTRRNAKMFFHEAIPLKGKIKSYIFYPY